MRVLIVDVIRMIAGVELGLRIGRNSKIFWYSSITYFIVVKELKIFYYFSKFAMFSLFQSSILLGTFSIILNVAIVDSLGTVQSAAVKGVLMCHGKPSVNTKVKLYDKDSQYITYKHYKIISQFQSTRSG